MALVTLQLESKHLYGNTTVSVILPDRPFMEDPQKFYSKKKKYKVLWLLHGTFGDHSDWVRKSMIELYATEKNYIVVMPSALNTVYENWPNFAMGYNMWDFVFEELMPLVYNWFPASRKREDNFVAGLSMGGRGTMKFVCAHPELFAKAAVLSSSPRDLREELAHISELPPQFRERLLHDIERAGGEKEFLLSNENTWDHCKTLVDNAYPVKLYFTCGEADQAYPQWLKFKAYAEEIGLDARFESVPSYRHEWRFWDLSIEKALAFFEER